MFLKLFSQAATNRRCIVNRPFVAVVIWASSLGLFGSVFVLSGCAANEQTAAQEGQSRPRRATTESTPSETNKEMSNADSSQNKRTAQAPFYAALEKALSQRGTTLEAVCDTKDAVAKRVLEDYGAMFVAADTVLPPPVCMFTAEEQVTRFHNDAGMKSANVGGTTIELQPAAMQALLEARKEAISSGLNITPRGGTEAARRDYEDTRRLWDTRFLPGLSHWQRKGRLTKEQVAHLRSLPINQQVGEVLELEKSGIFFSKDLSKSILYSIAAPGTSQHIAMLALDVSQFSDARVRRILAKHGWFQTVKSDLPHFTYLGVTEESLSSLGLHSVMSGEQKFWIPNIDKMKGVDDGVKR